MTRLVLWVVCNKLTTVWAPTKKLLVRWQFSGPYGITKYGSGWRKAVVNRCLEFVSSPVMTRFRGSSWAHQYSIRTIFTRGRWLLSKKEPCLTLFRGSSWAHQYSIRTTFTRDRWLLSKKEPCLTLFQGSSWAYQYSIRTTFTRCRWLLSMKEPCLTLFRGSSWAQVTPVKEGTVSHTFTGLIMGPPVQHQDYFH